MLIISRRKDQKIIVADEIEITVLEIGRNRVRLGIQAPKHIRIQTHPKPLPDDTPGRRDSVADIHELEIETGIFQHG